MSFSFQINNELKFRYDEVLLAKAEANRPQLVTEEHKPVRIVEIEENDTWLGGYGPAGSDKKIENLSDDTTFLFADLHVV